MAKLLRKKRQYPRTQVITEAELAKFFPGTPDSRHSKVKRMVAQGELVRLKRGLYCLTNTIDSFQKPHLFELAQYIYGPSFISLESALSYYQLIPEAVYTTTSVSGKRSKEFNTPLGIFSFQKVPLENLFTEVILVKEDGKQFFMAKPWRAICDYVYCNRKNWHSLEPLSESLRIPLESLPTLRNEEIQILDEYYHQKRMSRFLKIIQNNKRER